MKRKWLVLAGGGLVVVAIAVTLIILKLGNDENPNVARGKELLSVDEPEAAAREFKIALKQDPQDEEAKALLIVAVERKAKSLPTWYRLQQLLGQIQRIVDDPQLASLDASKDARKFGVTMRKDMYEKGIDTKNNEELARLTVRAARFSFERGEGEEKDTAAFVLALNGDSEAARHLVERLKSDRAEYVPELLVNLGESVEKHVVAMAADPESLGRTKALDVLARLRETQAAKSWFDSMPDLRGIKADDLAPDLARVVTFPTERPLTRDRFKYGVAVHENSTGLSSFMTSLSDDGSRRLLVFQGFKPSTKEIATQQMLIDGGTLVELSLQAAPDVMKQLAKEGPIESVTYDASTKKIAITQVGRGKSEATREVAKRSYAKGDRVRVRAIKKDGTVAGVDEFGLIMVALDEAHRGVRQMSLTEGAVRFLEPYVVERVVRRRFDATLDPAQRILTLVATKTNEDPNVDPWDDAILSKECLDNPLSKACQ